MQNITGKVIIRGATINDAVAICDLRKILWQATYNQPEYRQAVQNQDFTSPQQILTFANSIKGGNHSHLVAEYQGNIIGWAAVELIKNEIIALYVASDYQGKGIGKAFYRLLMKKLDTNKPIIIYAVMGNKRAQQFYHKNGFQLIAQPNRQEITEGLKQHKLPLVKMQLTPSAKQDCLAVSPSDSHLA
ncbi:MAG: GNAT family N-acetyltransferase [Alphaproteobacteria bacterium]|nr:GNAT family N-acetyltransferase [Alphaproteobacteria bacterium]